MRYLEEDDQTFQVPMSVIYHAMSLARAKVTLQSRDH